MNLTMLAGWILAVLVCIVVAAAAYFGANWVAWAVAALILVIVIVFVWWFGRSNPDDDSDEKPLNVGARRFLVVYLLVMCLLLIVSIMVLFSFDFTHDTNGKRIEATPTTVPKPAQYGYLATPYGKWWLSLDMQLLLLAVCAGALGSFLHAMKSLVAFLGNRTAKASWFWFYMTLPYLGSALALIFYAVFRGGLMTGAQADTAAVNPFGVVAICGMVGMFSDRASGKLAEVFETLFKTTTDEARKDKLAPANVDHLEPATVPLNGAVRDVTIRGTGLGGTAKVRVNGTDRAPTQVADSAVVFALQPADVTQRQRLRIQLVTTGGDLSKELILYISDIAITTNVLPPATVGQAYGPAQMEAAGTAVPRKWDQQGLPAGLILHRDTGLLDGTPAVNTAGVHQVKVTVTDNDGATATKTLPLTIQQ